MKLCRLKLHKYVPLKGSNRGCPDCDRNRCLTYYKNNKTDILKKQKAKKKENVDFYRQKQKKCYYKNRTENLIKKRLFYKNNKDLCNKWKNTINKNFCDLFRICNKCKVEKSHKRFTKSKQGTELYSICSDCKKLSIKSEKRKLYSKIYNEKNKLKKREYQKKYLKENKGKRNFWSSKRRALKHQATPKWLSKEQLKEMEDMYILAKDLQWLSDPTDPLHVDHIIPLQGKNFCGLHVPWNLQILPRSLNSKKSNKIK